MKINDKNTAIGFLNGIKIGDFSILNNSTVDDSAKRNLGISIIEKWPNLLPFFKKSVRYMSESFYQAYEKGAAKLSTVLDKEEIDEGGVLIYRPSSSETNTIFYKIQSKGVAENFDVDATIITFNKDTKRDRPGLAIVYQRRFGMKPNEAIFYTSNAGESNGLTPLSVFADIFSLILFIKYCEIDTKVIGAGKKDNHVGIKYVNESRSNIEVLDSTWFTTLIKSEAFAVRGHFRLQPHGAGMQQRKLIWISDYEKEGYTRKAKILTAKESEHEGI